MSHFTKIKTSYLQQHEAHLIKALEKHFGEGNIEVHPDGAELRAYTGELATKAGLGKTKDCHLIIRKKIQEKKAGGYLAVNDAGFARNEEGGYEVFVDEAFFDKKLQGLIAQDYTLNVSEAQLQAEGYSTSRVEQESGVVRLEARIYT